MPSSQFKKNSPVWNRQEYALFWHRQKWFIIAIFFVISAGFLFYSLMIPRYYSSTCVFVWDRIDLQHNNSHLPIIQPQPSPALYKGLIDEPFKERLLKRTREKFPNVPPPALVRIRRDLETKLRFEKARPQNSAALDVRSRRPELAYNLAVETMDLLEEKLTSLQKEEIQKVTRFLATKKEYIQTKIQDIDDKIVSLKLQNTNTGSPGYTRFSLEVQEIEKKLADTSIERELAESNLQAYQQQLKSMSLEMSESPFEESPLLLEQRRELDKVVEKRNRLANAGYTEESLQRLDQEIDQKKQQLIEYTLNQSKSVIHPFKKNIHPSVINELEKKILHQKLDLHVLRNQEQLYKKLLREQKPLASRENRHEHELAQLQKNKSIYNQLYASIVEELEDLMFILESGPESLRIIRAASIPKSPVPIYRSRIITLGVYLGIIFAFGSALLRHRRKKSLKNEIDVSKETNQPLLGIIPTANLKNHNYQKIEQTFTGICMKLYLQSDRKKMNSILLTSALQGEGKSFCAVNFFINCANLGKRVLLIDANLRNPKLNSIFDVPVSPGLSDYVLGYNSLQETTSRIHRNNSLLIAAGRAMENPVAVLSHQRMKNLLSMGTTKFDLVIIDGSHILQPANDPLIISKLVSHTLLVTQRSETPLAYIKQSLSTLQELDITITGIILNDISGKNSHAGNSKTTENFTRYDKVQA